MSNWYADSIVLLEEAEELLKEINQLEFDSVIHYDKLKKAQPKVKHFLDDCRSPLDYLAVHLRDTYTNSKQRVYFPFAYNIHAFKKRVKLDFKNKLPESILESIISVLPFYNQSQCLGWLNKLTNENKHQRLSNRTQILEQKINRIVLPGNNFISGTFTNCTGSPLRMGGVDYDLITEFPVNNADVVNRYILFFEDYNIEVVPLLVEILEHVCKVINEVNLLSVI